MPDRQGDDGQPGASPRQPARAEDGFGNEESSRPQEPGGWRDHAKPDYEYPADLEVLNRRERRKAKREWLQEDLAQRSAWLRNQRQAEPTSPLVVIVAVGLLAILVLGLGGGLPKLLGRDGETREPIGLLTPSAPVNETGSPGDETEPTPDASSEPTESTSPPPVVTERPSATSINIASHVTNLWAHAFYTRDPAKETYDQLVARSQKYLTTEVVESLTSAGDPTYDALRADGGTSSVVAAPVTPPREGSAPVDTPTRISRLITVTIDIKGKNADRITLPLLVTLVPLDGQWVISDVNGGTGP